MGLVLYPDDYTGSVLSGTVDSLPEGVVFLPAAGYRDGSNVSILGNGLYWSSTAYGNVNGKYYAYFVNFFSNHAYLGNLEARKSGCSVRLVTECQ